MKSEILDKLNTKTWNKEWRHAAIKSASQFLLRNSMGSGKRKNLLEQILKGAPIAIWSHQPNILPSCGVVAPVLQLYKHCEDARSIPVFLVIDYDEGGDQRFRAPCLPSLPNSDSTRYFLDGAVKKSDRKKVANTLYIDDKTVHRWEVNYRQNMLYWLRQLGNKHHVKDRGEVFSLFLGSRITEGSTLQILDSLDQIGIDDMLPVFASDIWGSVISTVASILLDLIKQDIVDGSQMLWWICPSCLERKKCHIDLSGTVKSDCFNCTTGIIKTLDNIEPHEFIPQHQLCNMIDLMFARADGYFMYYKSKYHFERSFSAVEQTGLCDRGPRYYTELKNFNPPLHIFDSKYSSDWNAGRYAFSYALNLFSRKQPEVIENIRSGSSTTCAAGKSYHER